MKKRFSAFLPGSSDIVAYLRGRGIDTVLIGGTATNVCCESSARDAMMLNFKVVMVHDVLATYTDEEHNATLRNFYSIFGDVQTLDEVDRLAQARAGEGGGVGFRGGYDHAPNRRAGVSTRMRWRWRASGVHALNRSTRWPSSGMSLGRDLRVRPIGAPDQAFGIGAHQRVVEGSRVGIIRKPSRTSDKAPTAWRARDLRRRGEGASGTPGRRCRAPPGYSACDRSRPAFGRNFAQLGAEVG